MGAEAEVLEKFALGFKRLQEAVAAVEDFLGMQTCDGTGRYHDVACVIMGFGVDGIDGHQERASRSSVYMLMYWTRGFSYVGHGTDTPIHCGFFVEKVLMLASLLIDRPCRGG